MIFESDKFNYIYELILNHVKVNKYIDEIIIENPHIYTDLGISKENYFSFIECICDNLKDKKNFIGYSIYYIDYKSLNIWADMYNIDVDGETLQNEYPWVEFSLILQRDNIINNILE